MVLLARGLLLAEESSEPAGEAARVDIPPAVEGGAVAAAAADAAAAAAAEARVDSVSD